MILVRAPLRIPLGGGGTDFPSFYKRHGGFLISMAINRYVHVLINRSPVDRAIRLRYAQSETVSKLDDVTHKVFREALRSAGVSDSVEIISLSDAAAGTGLGSSGSFTVALLLALHRFRNETVNPYALAEEAYAMEAERAGVPVGKQDQFIAAFGGLTCFDFAKSGKIDVNALGLSPARIEELRAHLLLFYTGIQRKSAQIAQHQDKATQRGNAKMIEALLHTKELGFKIKKALEEGRFDDFGRLMDEHWQAKRKRSAGVSTPEIDRWYELALSHGALGGKLIGSGGGGFLMFYCPPAARSLVRGAMAREGLLEMEYAVDFEGAKVLVDD